MVSTPLFISLLLLLSSGLAPSRALPLTLAPTSTAVSNDARPFGMAAAHIIAAVPSTVNCPSSNPGPCRTAAQIAPLINKSFSKFGFLSRGEQAAIFSLMAFESGNFAFDVNVFPGRPGQGTRNMMMFDFILPYALQYNRSAVRAIRSDLSPSSRASDVTDDAQKNAIRATVLDDTLSFASAAWFLRTHCSSQIATGLKSETDSAFNAYMGPDCIGAGEDPARLALYKTTLTAMGG